MIGGSESGKIYLLFNLISQPPDIIYVLKIHVKQNIFFLINKQESTGLKHLNGSKNL